MEKIAQNVNCNHVVIMHDLIHSVDYHWNIFFLHSENKATGFLPWGFHECLPVQNFDEFFMTNPWNSVQGNSTENPNSRGQNSTLIGHGKLMTFRPKVTETSRIISMTSSLGICVSVNIKARSTPPGQIRRDRLTTSRLVLPAMWTRLKHCCCDNGQYCHWTTPFQVDSERHN